MSIIDLKIGTMMYDGAYMGVDASGKYAYIMSDGIHEVTYDEAAEYVKGEWFIPSISEYRTISKAVFNSSLDFNEEQVWTSSKDAKHMQTVTLSLSGVIYQSIHKDERISVRLFKVIPAVLLSTEYLALEDRYEELTKEVGNLESKLADIAKVVNDIPKTSKYRYLRDLIN